MSERVFGPASSHGVPVNSGQTIKVRIRQESGETQTLSHLRFGVAQLEPQGTGLVSLPDFEEEEQPTSPEGTTGEWLLVGGPDGLGGQIPEEEGSTSYITLPDVEHSVTDVAWSPDGTRFAVAVGGGAGERNLYVVDASTGVVESGWPMLPSICRGVAWSPDGTRLAASHSSTPNLSVIDVATKTVESGWPETVEGVAQGGVAWSPDGARFTITHTSSPYLTVVDAATKAKEIGWPALPDDGRAAAWSPDGTRLAVGHDGSPGITVFDVATQTAESGWTPPTSVRSLGWSPDGARLAAARGSTAVYTVIDVETKTTESGWTSAPDDVWAVAWSPDGTRLALAHRWASDNNVQVRTVADKAVESGWPGVPGGNLAGSVAWAWDPGNTLS